MPEIDWTKAEEFVSTKKAAKAGKSKPEVVLAVRDGDMVHYKRKGLADSGVSSVDAAKFDAAWKKAK